MRQTAEVETEVGAGGTAICPAMKINATLKL